MPTQDLHRTGCGWFCGQDTPEERASLKRVLLAYARWNKSVGYCQGFNVIAALILQVMDRIEEDALKVCENMQWIEKAVTFNVCTILSGMKLTRE